VRRVLNRAGSQPTRIHRKRYGRGMDNTQRRKAANEAVFREVNERIEELQHRFSVAEHDLLQIVCECDRLDCMDHVTVSVATYERIRADSACFFLIPGHEDPSVEDVVDTGIDYLVVRKHPGEPQEVAEETDPRS
jgi:hypothetical protein